MQNRYFGDVGDFGKFGLLRALSGLYPSVDALSLGVVWYLVPDEGHNMDGKHISYLRKPEYRCCDPELYDGLAKLLVDGVRSVSRIQWSNLLPDSTAFFDEYLSFAGMPIIGTKSKHARLIRRDRWLSSAVRSVAGKELVFLDPDNGLEIQSVKRHADKGPKYVFWDEAEQFVSRHRTLIIYHHLNRTTPSRDQIRKKIEEFSQKLSGGEGVIPVLFKRGSHRVFFVLPAKFQRPLIKARLLKLQASPWGHHLEVDGL